MKICLVLIITLILVTCGNRNPVTPGIIPDGEGILIMDETAQKTQITGSVIIHHGDFENIGIFELTMPNTKTKICTLSGTGWDSFEQYSDYRFGFEDVLLTKYNNYGEKSKFVLVTINTRGEHFEVWSKIQTIDRAYYNNFKFEIYADSLKGE